MFWNRKLTGATCLFLLNRYIVIVFLILGIIPSGPSNTVRIAFPCVSDILLICAISMTRCKFVDSTLVRNALMRCPSCAELIKSATMFEYLMYLPWAGEHTRTLA